MNRKFIYFINPISGTNNKGLLKKMVTDQTTAQGIPFEILETASDNNYLFLTEKIKREAVTDVIVCGGDGTVNQVVAALQKVTVNIGIIPMGSGNGLALAANIPLEPEKALSIIFKGNAHCVDAFKINGQFSCMLCGLGFDAQVAHDFSRQHKRGLGTYVQQTVKNFMVATPYPFTVHLENESIQTEAFFISIANSNQFGNNVTIAPKASICDGLLDIVIVNKMSKLRMLYSVLKQVRMGQVTTTDKKYQGRDILYFQTRKLVIDNPQHAPLHIDGDPVTTADYFNIEIVPEAFRLLQPLSL